MRERAQNHKKSHVTIKKFMFPQSRAFFRGILSNSFDLVKTAVVLEWSSMYQKWSYLNYRNQFEFGNLKIFIDVALSNWVISIKSQKNLLFLYCPAKEK